MIIREITVYEAEDGTRFDNYEEAERYQISKDFWNLTDDDVIIKDGFGIKYNKEYWLTHFDEAFFVEIKNSLGKKFIDTIAEMQGLETIDGLGRYRWCEDKEEWISFDKEFRTFLEVWEQYGVTPN